MDLKFWLKRLLQLLGLMCGVTLLLVLPYRAYPDSSLKYYVGFCAIAQMGLESHMYKHDFPVMLRFGFPRIVLFRRIQIFRISGLVMCLLLHLLACSIFDTFGHPEASVVLRSLLGEATLFTMLTFVFSTEEKLVPITVAAVGVFALVYIGKRFPALALWCTLAYGLLLYLMAIFADRKRIMEMEV